MPDSAGRRGATQARRVTRLALHAVHALALTCTYAPLAHASTPADTVAHAGRGARSSTPRYFERRTAAIWVSTEVDTLTPTGRLTLASPISPSRKPRELSPSQIGHARRHQAPERERIEVLLDQAKPEHLGERSKRRARAVADRQLDVRHVLPMPLARPELAVRACVGASLVACEQPAHIRARLAERRGRCSAGGRANDRRTRRLDARPT